MRTDTDTLVGIGLPVFLEKTAILKEWIGTLSYDEKKKLWACSDKIAEQSAAQFAKMDLCRNLTPALLAYDGIQYTYMAPAVFEDGRSSERKYVFLRSVKSPGITEASEK